MGTTVTADSLLARLRQMSWPQPPLDAPDVRPGQVWRAAWEDVVCLIVVVAAPEGRRVRAAVASGEPMGDDRTVPVSTDSGLPVNVWSDVAASLPSFVLDQRVGDLSASVLAEVLAAVKQPPRRWPAITSIHDDRALFRASLLDALEALAELDWTASDSPAADNLRDLANSRGLKASALARMLDTTPGDGNRLLSGKRALTPWEADVLAAHFGEPVGTSVIYDDDLLAELDRPAMRSVLHRRAVDQFDGDEIQARRRIAEATWALAARHRDQGPRNWRVLIEEHLRAD
jgi:hypothetical protein